MATKVVTVTSISDPAILTAAALLQRGELVAFPTETVYGLGADATNPKALKKIFAVKNRPADNPLIVHIASWSQLKEVAQVSPTAMKLARAFWPGPLTLLLPKRSLIAPEATAGSAFVAVRWPSNPIAQTLIKKSGLPIAAPSANRSGSPSPTEAAHVLADIENQIPLILDGGASEIGLESTLVDARDPDSLTILRPGSITQAEIKRTTNLKVVSAKDASLVTPGTKYNHYQPKTPVILFTHIEKLTEYIQKHPKTSLGYLGIKAIPQTLPYAVVAKNQKHFAQILYKTMREADHAKIGKLLILSPIKLPNTAIGDRLIKASTEIVD